MKLNRQPGEWTLLAARYRLVFLTERPYVLLETPQGELLAELFVFSSVHPLDGRDDTYQVGDWKAVETTASITVSIEARSTTWQRKIYRFACSEDRLTYSITIEPMPGTDHALGEAHYFGGYYSGNLRWGSGYYWSGQEFKQLFNPEPNIPEQYHVPASSGSKIDLTGVPIPARGDWFFTPPPMCYAVETAAGWLGIGVEAAPGANTFTEFNYHGNLEAFALSLSYEGHTHVRNTFELPAIGFDFAADEYGAIKAHVAALRRAGLVTVPGPEAKPDWWRTPIFCGWGPQCYLAAVADGKPPAFARQPIYERFMAVLDNLRLDPGIIVIDDQWQEHYGVNSVDTTKWPDLRGFVDCQHARGRKVLLWLKSWDPDGVPLDECVTNAGGEAIAVDMTNPAYERRFRQSVRRMMSEAEDGYGADGFKVDFTARIPSGFGLRSHNGAIWGIELMRRYLEVLRDEARQVKPDALIMTHTAHPYLADVVDMLRLNDINKGSDVNRAMRHRARVARIAVPEALIDTDNWPVLDKAAWRAYTAIQPELGIPSLYTLTHIDSTLEPLNGDDYALIRQVWAPFRPQPQ